MTVPWLTEAGIMNIHNLKDKSVSHLDRVLLSNKSVPGKCLNVVLRCWALHWNAGNTGFGVPNLLDMGMVALVRNPSTWWERRRNHKFISDPWQVWGLSAFIRSHLKLNLTPPTPVKEWTLKEATEEGRKGFSQKQYLMGHLCRDSASHLPQMMPRHKNAFSQIHFIKLRKALEISSANFKDDVLGQNMHV